MDTEQAIKQAIDIFVKQGLTWDQINNLLCGLFYGKGSWTLEEATDYARETLRS